LSSSRLSFGIWRTVVQASTVEHEGISTNGAAKPPKQWPGPEEFIADLRQCRWQDWLQKMRTDQAQHGWPAIIKYWVGPSTLRALRNMAGRPWEGCREWAVNAVAGW